MQALTIFLPSQIVWFLEENGFDPTTNDQVNLASLFNIDKCKSDIELFNLLEYYFFIALQIEGIRSQIQTSVISAMTKQECKLCSLVNSSQSEIFQPLEKAKEFVFAIIHRILDHPENSLQYTPRLIRLGKRLNLTNKEFIAFAFALVSQSGSLLAESLSSQMIVLTLSSMSRVCKMNTKEMFDFISQDRLYIQQGLITVDTSYRDSLSSSTLKMPKECLHVLVGSKITSEEFLKIDKTVLSEILLEESNFNVPGIKKSSKEPEVTKGVTIKSDLDSELEALENELDAEEEENEEFDLYEYMKEEQDKKEEQVGITQEDGVEDSFLAPYKNNIDYLDDRFKYLTAKIQLRNTEIDKKSDEIDSSEYKTTRDRSYDSVLREIQGKCRLLSGKCEKRLKATTSFIPRLEKIGEMRGLNEFEKWVLIFCVASTLSHDVAVAKNASSSRNSYGLTVGYLLWILCEDLEERISHRSFFYKKGKLIQDGMIKLSDNISDDLMESTVDIDRRMLDYLCGLDSEFSELVEGRFTYTHHSNQNYR